MSGYSRAIEKFAFKSYVVPAYADFHATVDDGNLILVARWSFFQLLDGIFNLRDESQFAVFL